MKHLACIGLLLLPLLRLQAQDSARLRYPVVNDADNVIQNDDYLQPFFEKLVQLKGASVPQVNIIHIGDSHIQADYLTEVVRTNLQNEFGNAGRGLIVPGRVAGTNEPGNFRSFSTVVWNSKRLVHPTKPLPIGIGGITIHTDNPNASFTVRMNNPARDRFNTVSFFYHRDKSSFTLSVRDSALNELGKVPSTGPSPHDNYYKLALPATTNQMVVQMIKEDEEQRQATLFGINLENGSAGVIYHAIGVNGAKYEHYLTAPLFASQCVLLQPDLFIISLGTNEAVEYPRVNAALRSYISGLVESLSKANPSAHFVLVTPPDAYIRKVKVNPGIEIVRDEILRFAVENGIAFWDMYKVNGGHLSAAEWKTKGMLRPDGVHFTKEGYAFQGQLLFEAIMKSYVKYVANRHP